MVPGNHIERPSPSRGWIVAFAGLGINLALGVLYSWSIFAKALTSEWQWTTARAELPYSVAVAFFALVTAFAGRAQDRWGPRLVATAGGLLMGSGLVLSSTATPTSTWPVVLGFGVLTGSGIAMAFVSTFPSAAKWFPPARRGVVTGLVVSGFGIAAVYIAPLTTTLLARVGIERTFLYLGAAFVAVTVGLAQLLRDPPRGWAPPTALAGAKVRTCPTAERESDWHEMIRTRQFVLLWLMYGLTAFAGVMIIGHMAQITAQQLEADLGFLLVAVLAIGNASGRIVAGLISDRIGSVRTMTIVFGLQAVMMLLLGQADTTLLLSAAAFVVGFDYGADLSLFPCIVSEYYGTRNQGVNYGLVFTSWGVGGVLGSMAAGVIFDSTGSYAGAFLLAAACCAVAAGLTLLTRPPSTSSALGRRSMRRLGRPSRST